MDGSVLAFEPWDAGSHRAVRASIDRHGRLDWRFMIRPGRSPRWRLRHAALEFAATCQADPIEEAGERPLAHAEVAAVHATGMLSLADLRAVMPPTLRNRPFILSMHENQAAYPVSDSVKGLTRERDAHLAFTNLASIEAADRVVWNSRWNLESFIQGMSKMMRHAPEPVDDDWIRRARDKSIVVPPPIELGEIEEAAILRNTPTGHYRDDPDRGREPVLVAWPHRWEHDKGCEELLEIADEAARREDTGGPAVRWVILGHQPPNPPEAMLQMLQRHKNRIAHAGKVDRARYLDWLIRCDWVLSTARHEFFGMAVAESLLAGCLPWLPSRLAYPELVPKDALGLNPWTRPSNEAIARLRPRILEKLERARADLAVDELEKVILETADSHPRHE